jgi:hypothetical protein
MAPGFWNSVVDRASTRSKKVNRPCRPGSRIDRVIKALQANLARHQFIHHLDQMFERATKARFRAFRFQSTIAQLGRLKVKWSRDFTSEPSTETLSRDPSGRYFVSLRLDKPVIK